MFKCRFHQNISLLTSWTLAAVSTVMILSLPLHAVERSAFLIPTEVEQASGEYASLVQAFLQSYCKSLQAKTEPFTDAQAIAMFQKFKDLDFNMGQNPAAGENTYLVNVFKKTSWGGPDLDHVLITFAFNGCKVSSLERILYREDGTLKGRDTFSNETNRREVKILVPDPIPLEEIYAPCKATLSKTQFEELIGFSKDTNKVVVAILDNGVDYNDPKIAFRLAHNSQGHLNGYNATNGTHLPAKAKSDSDEETSHGMDVSQLLLDGTSTTVVLSVSIIGTQLPDFKAAVAYAKQNGARVINMSFKVSPGTPQEKSLKQAIEENPDIAFVAGAGNDGKRIDSNFVIVPAAWQFPNLLTVASVGTGTDKILSDFSNYGPSVQIAALGVYLPNREHGMLMGTSYAAPEVSKAIAEVLHANSALTAQEAILIILSTVDPVPSLKDKVSSGGVLNLRRAVAKARGEEMTSNLK
jgi:subtilisin family serine protease